MPPGFSPLLVTSNDQNYFDDGLSFEHVKWPQIIALTPSQGPVLGGTEVVLLGTNVHPPGVRGLYCHFTSADAVAASYDG